MRWCYRPSVPLGRTEGTPRTRGERESARKVTSDPGTYRPHGPARHRVSTSEAGRLPTPLHLDTRGHTMRMLRMLAATSAAALTGLAMAGTAHAGEEMPTRPYAVHEVDGCEVTVHATSPAEWRDGSARTWPVMLVVDAGDQVDVLTVEPGESATAGPYGLSATTVAYRVFGGPERDDDSPAWDADRDTIAAHIAAHGDDWVTGGTAET